MTTTTGPDCDNVTMDDTSLPLGEEQQIHHDSSPKETTLKFIFKVKKTKKVDPAQLHCNILTTIENLDRDKTFLNQQNNTFSPNKVQNFPSKFTYETFPRKHYQLICVAHKLKLSQLLNHLKSDMRNVLSATHATITVHTWSILNTRDVGWLLHMHPHFHNCQDIHQQLSKILTKTTIDKEIPEFQLYVKTVTDGNANASQSSSAQAIIIESASNNVHSLQELLHTAYNSQSPLLPEKFIPANYQHIENK